MTGPELELELELEELDALDVVERSEMLLFVLELLVFCPQFEGFAGSTLGFGGKGGGTVGSTGVAVVVFSIAVKSRMVGIVALVKDNRGAGTGLLVLLVDSVDC